MNSSAAASGLCRPKAWASDATVLMNTAGPIGSFAVAECDFPAFEVAEEFLPFGVGWNAVFLAGTQGAAPGYKGPVAVDGLFGVDGLIAHCRVDVTMPDYKLGDMRGHAIHYGVGDKNSAEIVWDESQWLAVVAGEAGGDQRIV